jgi:hypothetical protein
MMIGERESLSQESESLLLDSIGERLFLLLKNFLPPSVQWQRINRKNRLAKAAPPLLTKQLTVLCVCVCG